MSEIDRDAFLELLEQLLSDKDEEVLASARAIKQQMTDADVGWDLLLVQAPGDDDHDEDDDHVYGEDHDGDDYGDDEDEEDATETGHARAAGSPKDDLALIDELLNKHEVSDATREELEEYKIDIGDGDFTEADHNYLLALYQRVTGKKR